MVIKVFKKMYFDRAVRVLSTRYNLVTVFL